MTLGELKAKLAKVGIKQVGAMTRSDPSGSRTSHTFIFTSDEKVVFPFGLKTVYFLTLDSKEESTPVNSEKIKAIIRAVQRDRGSSESDVTWFTI